VPEAGAGLRIGPDLSETTGANGLRLRRLNLPVQTGVKTDFDPGMPGQTEV